MTLHDHIVSKQSKKKKKKKKKRKEKEKKKKRKKKPKQKQKQKQKRKTNKQINKPPHIYWNIWKIQIRKKAACVLTQTLS